MSDNRPEYTVTELAGAIKRTLEDGFGRVRVRGELGRVTVASSGHCYLDVKDDKAVINGIIWRGVMNRLPIRPEEGMEVIVEGKVSSYPGRSNYQLIIDHMEPAGAGALMALLEKRKKMLAAEGLFSEDRKKDLPYLPSVIGVVTSPTGSVIRDIIHRIEDRFPARVIVWPVAVQGETSAAQVTAAINGFNALGEGSDISRPDVIIVARGGGSLEDLWGFNEENVARAAAASEIPLISAVGHETDWTLLDYVADYRAPTPTGAAEVAVPVRADLLDFLEDQGLRIKRGLTRMLSERKSSLTAAKLPRAETLLAAPRQSLDLALARLPAPSQYLDRKRQSLTALRLPALTRLTQAPQERLMGWAARLTPALRSVTSRKAERLRAQRLPAAALSRELAAQTKSLRRATQRLSATSQNIPVRASERLTRASNLLRAYSFEGTLSRGFALVMDERGALVRDGARLSAEDHVALRFAGDVTREAVITDGGPAPKKVKAKPNSKTKPKSKPKSKSSEQKQMGLF